MTNRGTRTFVGIGVLVLGCIASGCSGPPTEVGASAHRAHSIRRSSSRLHQRTSGTIARLLIDKGFGFVRDDRGIEYFFHRSGVPGGTFEFLRQGQRVEFAVEESTKGPRATDVRLIE